MELTAGPTDPTRPLTGAARAALLAYDEPTRSILIPEQQSPSPASLRPRLAPRLGSEPRSRSSARNPSGAADVPATGPVAGSGHSESGRACQGLATGGRYEAVNGALEMDDVKGIAIVASVHHLAKVPLSIRDVHGNLPRSAPFVTQLVTHHLHCCARFIVTGPLDSGRRSPRSSARRTHGARFIRTDHQYAYGQVRLG